MEKDLIVTCPYNSSHRIRRYKLISHITKCKKQYDIGNKAICPLNNSHIVDCNQLAEHIESCPNLATLVHNDDEEIISPEPAMNTDTHKLFEDWDKLPEAPSYDAMEHSAKKSVIRCINGLSKSEKKKFREKERVRLADLDGINTTKAILSKDTEDEISLRPPRGQAEVLRCTEAMQNDSFKGGQMYNPNADRSAKSTVCNQLLDSFHKALYDELLSDYESDANTKKEDMSISYHDPHLESEDFRKIKNVLLKKPVSSDTIYTTSDKSLNSLRESSGVYSQDIDNEGKRFPIFSQNHKTEVNEVQKYSDRVRVRHEELDDAEKKHDYIERPFDTSISRTGKQITDKLLVSLRSDANTNVEKVEPMVKMEKDIQNPIYEHSPSLIKQLNDLQSPKEDACVQSFNHNKIPNDILNNPRCAAKFTEYTSSIYKAQLKTTDSESKQTFAQGNQSISECNLNRDNHHHISNLNDYKSGRVFKLKTPQDFS